MSDPRRRIAALRAKAESTTFPAEAAALRAKADELEASLPPEPQREPELVLHFTFDTTGNTFVNGTTAYAYSGWTIRFE